MGSYTPGSIGLSAPRSKRYAPTKRDGGLVNPCLYLRCEPFFGTWENPIGMRKTKTKKKRERKVEEGAFY